MCGGAVATGRRSKNYHTLPHFETEAQHVVSSFCCLLPTADCGLPTLSAASWLCLREKDTCPGQRDGCWLLLTAADTRPVSVSLSYVLCAACLWALFTHASLTVEDVRLYLPPSLPPLSLHHSPTLSLFCYSVYPFGFEFLCQPALLSLTCVPQRVAQVRCTVASTYVSLSL